MNFEHFTLSDPQQGEGPFGGQRPFHHKPQQRLVTMFGSVEDTRRALEAVGCTCTPGWFCQNLDQLSDFIRELVLCPPDSRKDIFRRKIAWESRQAAETKSGNKARG